MLLTEIIQKSTAAISLRRNATDNAAKAKSYLKALTQLDLVAKNIENSLDCAAALKAQGIISEPIIAEDMRTDLLSCIDSCGNGLSPKSADKLSLAEVKLLQSKSNSVATSIKAAWKQSASNYANGVVGYLTMIGGLTDNPKQASELVEQINKSITDDPSIKVISKLTADIAEAEKIIDEFSLNAEIECFLKKVSSQRATIADLTPDIIAWLNEKKLMHKLKVRF